MRIWSYSISVVLFLVFLSACTNQRLLSSDDAVNYATSYTGFSPVYKVYHSSADSSELHVKLNSSQLLFSRNNSKQNFTASLEIEAAIYEEETREFLDSLKTGYSHVTEEIEEQTLYSKTTFKLPSGKNYVIDLTYKDINRKMIGQKSLRVDKIKKFAPENFLIYTTNSIFPEFNTHCSSSFPVTIVSELVNLNDVKISSRKAELTLPPPPYSGQNTTLPEKQEFTPLNLTKTKNSINVTPEFLGDIFVSSEGKGIIFLIRPNSYPKVSSTRELVLPLRYISARREFEKMSEASNIKDKLDKFWMECGSNKDRAKILIKSYYTRVEDSNNLFSSFKSGWRTDRGLIHIIFGFPNEIKKSSDSETWIYGDRSSLGSVEFKFNKVENPYSSNHFELERNPIYKSEWARRVNAWRNGRIYD